MVMNKTIIKLITWRKKNWKSQLYQVLGWCRHPDGEAMLKPVEE